MMTVRVYQAFGRQDPHHEGASGADRRNLKAEINEGADAHKYAHAHNNRRLVLSGAWAFFAGNFFRPHNDAIPIVFNEDRSNYMRMINAPWLFAKH